MADDDERPRGRAWSSELEPPAVELARLSHAGETGELVSVCPEVEVHVFLQSGRVAWATSSTAQLRFSRELQRRGVDAEALKEVVAHCRTTRAPVGETLVAWGAASFEDVRESLRLQIEDAIAAMLRAGRGRTLFLRRGFAGEYDTRFTFDLAEVLPPLPSEPTGLAASERAAALRALLPDLRWIGESHHGELSPHPWPAPATERVARHAFDDGADFLAMRLEDQLVVGLELLESDGSIWIGLPPSTHVGAALAALAQQIRPSYAPPRTSRIAPTTTAERAGCCVTCGSLATDAIERFEEVLSVSVLGGEPPCIACRDPQREQEVRRVTERHAWLLEGTAAKRPAIMPAIALGLGRAWWFGGRPNDDSDRQLWVSLDRTAAQGIGWALTATLLRQIEARPCERGRARQH